MTTLLRIDASARRQSLSRQIADTFTHTWKTTHPDGRYLHRDLATHPAPQIDEAWTQLCDNVMARQITDVTELHQAAITPTQKTAWQTLEPLLAELIAADTVLIATPMYNYSIPASLKAWIDQVTFPKMALTGRRIVIASARGGAYTPGAPKAPYDHQESYLRDFFAGHFAITDVQFIHTEMANSRIDPGLAEHRPSHDKSLATAHHEATTAARNH